MMSDKDNNLLKSDILTVGSELSKKLNAIGVPNTFGKASEGKDNLVSIIRMAINGIDMIIEQIREKLKDYYNKSEVNTLLNGKSDTSHNHDGAYANKNHNHDGAYANISHNHDNLYVSKNQLKNYYNTSEVNTLLNGKSDTSHNHDGAYANISHNHDNAYASKSHQHNGADVILSNNNNVDTEIGTIENNITSLINNPTNTSKEILENDDLNNYTDIGFYYCPFGSVAKTLSNCPVVDGFALFVEKYSGYEGGCTQTVTTYTGTRLLKFIRTFQTLDDGTFQHSDWLPLYDDTGWQTINWASGFATHSTGREARVRRIGNIVQLDGWAKNTKSMTFDANNPKTILTLPTEFRPVRSYTFLCQGSGMAIYDLSISANGKVEISRYRTTNSTSTSYSNFDAGQWLPFSVTYMV